MSLTWFKIPIAEFLKETRRMNLWARGAYITLLADYYENGPPTTDDIGNITGDDEVNMNVFGGLFELRDGRWHHTRADRDIADRAKLTQRSVANGSKGGRKPRGHAIVEETSSALFAEVSQMMKQPEPQAGDLDDYDDDGDDLTSAPKVQTSTSYIGKPPPAAPAPEPIEADEEAEDNFTPIPEDFTLDGAEVSRCLAAGATSTELAAWFDEFKSGHDERGTLSSDWPGAWQARFRGKMQTKPVKGRARVEVSRRA